MDGMVGWWPSNSTWHHMLHSRAWWVVSTHEIVINVFEDLLWCLCNHSGPSIHYLEYWNVLLSSARAWHWACPVTRLKNSNNNVSRDRKRKESILDQIWNFCCLFFFWWSKRNGNNLPHLHCGIASFLLTDVLPLSLWLESLVWVSTEFLVWTLSFPFYKKTYQ